MFTLNAFGKQTAFALSSVQEEFFCKFWFCIALVAAAVNFRSDVSPNILLSTHRQ